jgi:hypothetical protein
VVQGPAGEVLIPLAADFVREVDVREVDLPGGRLVVVLPQAGK